MEPEIRIIVAGSRTFYDFELLCNSLDLLIAEYPHLKPVIISGSANGADKLGEAYAQMCGLELVRMPALWDRYGKSAGYIRNQEMLDYACEDGAMPYLIAFWDGNSKGTKHMISIAAKAGIAKRVVKYNN